MVIHVVNHTATGRGIRLDASTRDDLVAEVFLAVLRNDYAILRRFRRNCSLVTYMTVIARRVVLRRLDVMARNPLTPASELTSAVEAVTDTSQTRLDDTEEVEHLMLRLDPKEADVVRMFHLEGKSYEEISKAVGMSENSIGPVLTRARARMRQDQ